MRPIRFSQASCLIGALAVVTPAGALQGDAELTATTDDGVYAVVNLRDLQTFDLDDPAAAASGDSRPLADALAPSPGGFVLDGRDLVPRATLDGAGAIVVSMPDGQALWNTTSVAPTNIAVRLSAARDVSGHLFVPTDDGLALLPTGFRIPASAFGTEQRADYWLAMAGDAERHLAMQDSGSAWFRHVRDSALAAAGEQAADDAPTTRPSAKTIYTMQGSFSLLSGGRALSENLALDELLPVSARQVDALPIDSIAGVTVQPYDWDALVADIDPALDTLAALIPADQHAVFFSSFEALVAVSDEAEQLGRPLLLALEARSQTAHTRQRYEQQLGLTMSELARLLGPQLIASVALTGGDAYLRTGSDIALLFEATDSLATLAAITARVNLSCAGRDDVERVNGEVSGQPYTGLRNADRSVCSYIATIGPAVVVTNSTVQLERLVLAARGSLPVLAELPEYRWFRQRYPLGDPDESALLVLSDETIRRWCGPRLRIGSSRRARAAAVLSELRARGVTATEHGPADPAPAPTALANIGLVRDDGARLHSADFGNLAFATPIAELELDWVSEEEEAFYVRWLAGYERNWREVFDPIAVRLSIGPQGLAVDTTVRPLILNSDYESLARYSLGGLIEPHAGDLHSDALLHYALAIDAREVDVMPELGLFKVLAPNLDLFGWLGTSISLYADDTDYWDDMNAQDAAEDDLLDGIARLPLALQAEVDNTLKLALFLTGMRGLIESSAPGTTAWETRNHRAHPYVRVSECEPTYQGGDPLALYYVSGPEGLTLTLSEELVQRVIDRRIQRQQEAPADGSEASIQGDAPAAKKLSGDDLPSWIGEHLAMRMDGDFLTKAMGLWGDASQRDRRQASWRNLPILNVWHERFPGEDPPAVHERLFERTLICPGGGGYRWNEEFRTMESTVFGHPGQPRGDSTLPAVLRDLSNVQLGLSFEEDGLRARVRLQRIDGGH